MRHVVLTENNQDAAIADAVETLRQGELVAIPTETVYGLAADAANGKAVAKIFEAKGRPRFNPLICHVTGLAMAQRYGDLDQRAMALAEGFWPGPLSLVVPLRAGAQVHPLATANLSTIALRAPRGLARDIIARLDRAVAAPSANRSGRISPTRADHVVDQLSGLVSLILDAGPCEVGLESTIVSLVGERPRLLRPGGIPARQIEELIGQSLERATSGDPIVAPGMLASHYAPRLPLRLNVSSIRPGEAVLSFGEAEIAGAAGAVAERNLSPGGNLVEAAANLFAFLSELDRSSASAIAVSPIPTQGLGEAINDRLARAATPRS